MEELDEMAVRVATLPAPKSEVEKAIITYGTKYTVRYADIDGHVLKTVEYTATRIDLLSFIDLALHAIKGEYHYQGDSIVIAYVEQFGKPYLTMAKAEVL